MSSQAHLVRVGLFVVTGFLVFVSLLVWLGYWTIIQNKGTTFQVRFVTVKGIKPGADVRLNGVAVGTVEEVRADPAQGGAVVVVRLSKDRQVGRRSLYRVTVGSLLGEATLDVFSCRNPHDPTLQKPEPMPECHPSIPDGFLEDGEMAEGIYRANKNLDDVVEEFAGVIESLRNETIGGINDLLAQTEGILNDLGGRLGDMVDEVKDLTSELRTTAEGINEGVEEILATLQQVAANVEQTTDALSGQIEGVMAGATGTLDEANDLIAQLAEQAEGLDLDGRLDTLQADIEAILADFSRLSAALASEENVASIRSTVANLETLSASATETMDRLAALEQDGEVRLLTRFDDTDEDSIVSEVRFGLRSRAWYAQMGAEWVGDEGTLTLVGGWRRGDLRLGAGLRREAPTAELRFGRTLWIEGQVWWPDTIWDIGYRVGVGIPIVAGGQIYIGYEDDALPGTDDSWLVGMRYGF
ncbi:MCE family protein [bacterium]|nr:MCE family protein [bacterium]